MSRPRIISGCTRLRASTTGLNRPEVGLASYMNGLRMVGDRSIAVHRDSDRSHTEENEGDQAKGKNGGGESELLGHDGLQRGVLGEIIRQEHEREDGQAHPKRRHVASHET